jgi:hypothetical protein
MVHIESVEPMPDRNGNVQYRVRLSCGCTHFEVRGPRDLAPQIGDAGHCVDAHPDEKGATVYGRWLAAPWR